MCVRAIVQRCVTIAVVLLQLFVIFIAQNMNVLVCEVFKIASEYHYNIQVPLATE